ncbi:MAG: DHH family phosphoesterase [Candidatus Pacearchaeota archaeon]|nr:DHH family phosphoesterase [Candidatus Pacearchaeota archaeon]
MNSIKNLFPYIKDEEFIYIQTHNFPDHDAVASGFGLQYLLKQEGIKSRLIYEGTIQRESLVALIDKLAIPIKPAKVFPIKAEDKIVIVDGCKGNKNVMDLIGDEVAVIDHHEVTSPEDVEFSDIRPEYGACSTLIFKYFKELGHPIPPDICTALLCGLNVDTLQLSRGVCEADVEAYAGLYTGANVNFVNSILRNSIQVKDLDFYKSALAKVVIRDRFAFCYFEEGCNQNLMGILGDFFLSLQEVDFVFLCARNNAQVNFSLRSEVKKWNSALIIQGMLKGIGFGGGHADMAGGIIKDLSLFNEQDLLKRLNELLL